MLKAKQNNKGAILVLILLMTSAVISAGAILLYTSTTNYKMKHINIRVKKALYNAEGALNEAYAIAIEYIESALEYAYDKGNFENSYLDFLFGNCEDMPNHVSLVDYLEDNSNYLVYNYGNIFIEAEIFHKLDYLQLDIVAVCVDDRIEKKVKMICHILIPEEESSYDSINPEDLIYIYEWILER